MSKRQEQWLEVGMAFEKARGERNFRERAVTLDGLCYAMAFLEKRPRHYGIIAKMLGHTGYWEVVRDPEWSTLRATFAYLMAAMTDSERDAIVEGL